MHRWYRGSLLLFGLAVLCGTVRAERKPYVPDRAHCQINFVGDSLLVSAHGFFERWDADFQIDRNNPENSTVQLTIDAASLNTRVQARDNHLRSADFFDVARYPQITFVSRKVSKTDDSNLVVTGDLTMRGITRSVDLPVRIVFLRDNDSRFKGELKLNRKDFGMTYNSRMSPIEDLVEVQFDMHLSDKQAAEERQRQRPQQPSVPAP